MFNPERLLGQVMNGMFSSGDREKKNKGISAMGGFGGGMKLQAGLGLLGVAMAAFEHFKDKQGGQGSPAAPGAMPPPPPPPMPMAGAGPSMAPSPPVSMPPPVATGTVAQPAALPAPQAAAALHLLRSMIAAAHADGVLDAAEREAIVGRAREAKLPPEDLMALGSELAAPRALSQIIAETPAEYRRETYAAALLAITVDTEAERSFLAQLATGLGLPASDVTAIHQQLGFAG